MLALRYVLLVGGTFVCGYWVASMRGEHKWLSFLAWIVCVIAYVAMSVREWRRGEPESKKAKDANEQAQRRDAPQQHEDGGAE